MSSHLPTRNMTLVVLASLALCATALAAPPKVIELYPPHGAVDVKPGAVELRIVFDCDMSTQGMSICGKAELRSECRSS